MLERYASIPAVLFTDDDNASDVPITVHVSEGAECDGGQTYLTYQEPSGRVITLCVGWAASEVLETALRVARPRRR